MTSLREFLAKWLIYLGVVIFRLAGWLGEEALTVEIEHAEK